MLNVTRALIVAAASVALFAQACTLASPTHITEQPAAATAGDDDDSATSASSTASTSSTAPATSACTPTFTKPDVSTLTACATGGHCYDSTKVPNGSQLFGQNSCNAGQLCVGDEILEANGGKLASCTSSVAGGAGACANVQLMPQALAQGATALKQDGCAAGLTCMPCADPLHGGADTGFCDPIGVSSTACADTGAAATGAAATAPAAGCCTTNGVSNGQCIPASAVPSSSSSMTSQDSCSTGNVCAPKALVTGAPKTCDGGFLALGGPSICLDKCFSSGVEGSLEGLALDQDACGTTEFCVPCNLIKLGAGDTPVPGCGN